MGLQPKLERDYCEMRIWASDLRSRSDVSQQIKDLNNILIQSLDTYDTFKHIPTLKDELWQTCKDLAHLIVSRLSA